MGNVDIVRCAHCGEILGVYEPIVARREDGLRHTSMASEPRLPESGEALFHPICLPPDGASGESK